MNKEVIIVQSGRSELSEVVDYRGWSAKEGLDLLLRIFQVNLQDKLGKATQRTPAVYYITCLEHSGHLLQISEDLRGFWDLPMNSSLAWDERVASSLPTCTLLSIPLLSHSTNQRGLWVMRLSFCILIVLLNSVLTFQNNQGQRWEQRHLHCLISRGRILVACRRVFARRPESIMLLAASKRL